MRKSWEENEILFLKENYETKTRGEIASILGRSEQSIKNKTKELSLIKKKDLEIDEKYVVENFEKHSLKELAEKFNCAFETIKSFCLNLGLSKEYKEISIGTQFGKLTTCSKEYRIKNRIVVDCLCECGNKKIAAHRTTLFSGETWNCGCDRRRCENRKKSTKPRPRKYEKFKTEHKLYNVWRDCKRNVGVYEKWLDYNVFYDWAIDLWKENLYIYRKNINLPHSSINSFFVDSVELNRLIKKNNPDIYEKAKKTNIKKYGAESPLSSESVKEKVKKTNNEKYGVNYITQTDFFINKSKKTCLEKYNVEHYRQSEESKERFKRISLERYGTTHPMKNKDLVKKIIKKNKENGVYKVIDGKTVSEWCKEIGINTSSMTERISRYGDSIAVLKPKHISGIEVLISNLLEKLDVNYQKDQIIDRKIPDFLIEDRKLIIECDGLYWHSEAKKEKDYHKIKRETYINNGYMPLFFYEDEILNKMDIIESIILNKLGKSKRIFGRKCVIKELETKISSEFCKTNHLMGKGSGKGFGLYYNKELICVMRVTKKKDGLDISRFCCKNGYSVIGGFSKLLKYIINSLSPKFIQTFTDLRYGSGEYLKDMGFNIESESLSFNWIKDDNRLHRLNFPGNSGYESGFIKLWDCGQRKWVYNV